MKRLTKLNKGDTRRVKKALTSMHKALDELERAHKALDELERVLSPKLASTEQTSDTEMIRIFMDLLLVFRTMTSMMDYTQNFCALMDQLHHTPTTLESPRREVLTPKYPDPAQIDWDEARGTLTTQEYTILEYRLGAKEKPRTLEVVGQDFQITKERVRQIQKTAISKLETAGLLIK